jgi:hypothetical protein
MKYGRRKRQRRQARSSTASTAPAPSTGTTQSTEAAQGSAGRNQVRPWWEREPGRLEYELAQLQAAGITYQVDEEAKSRGRLVIDLEVTNEQNEKLELKARFPDLYPYFRFEILAPTLNLPHHQQPFGKQLCILGRATANWHTSDTLAGLTRQQVPSVLSSGRSTSRSDVAGVEEHQGEPFGDYYSYAKDSMILVDGAWSIAKAITSGTLTLGLAEQPTDILRGAVLRVCDPHGHRVAEADPALTSLYKKQIEVRWVRTEQPIRENDPNAFLDGLRAQHEQLRKPLWRVVGGGKIDVVGVIFPEEHSWRENCADGWLFVVQVRKHYGRNALGGSYLARAGRAGRADLTSRVPELLGLQQKKIVIVGNGALGGPSAIHFARAGLGELRLLDCDYVDPPTVVRWSLGLRFSGKAKVETLKEFIEQNYPYTRVKEFVHRIGYTRESPDQRHDLLVLEELISGVDLIYDASAEVGINHLLSDLAAEYRIPYICVSTTHGAWGGRLIRVRPGKTSGCWMCHQWAIETDLIPIPRSDPKGEVQPAGCADPTFTGSGFDVESIALAGVRLAVGTMQSGILGGYPDVDWDIAVINLRDESGRLTVPQWEVFALERHPSCENHKAHSWNGMASTAGG